MVFADESPTRFVRLTLQNGFVTTYKPRLLTSKATSAAKRTCVTGVSRQKNTVSRDV